MLREGWPVTVPISEDMLRAYEEGRLDRARRGIVAAHLMDHPDEAAPVLERMLLNQAVAALGADDLHEPVPGRMRETIRQRLDASAHGEPAGASRVARAITIGMALLAAAGLGAAL